MKYRWVQRCSWATVTSIRPWPASEQSDDAVRGRLADQRRLRATEARPNSQGRARDGRTWIGRAPGLPTREHALPVQPAPAVDADLAVPQRGRVRTRARAHPVGDDCRLPAPCRAHRL